MRWLLCASVFLCLTAHGGEVGPRRALLSSSPSWLLPGIAGRSGAVDMSFYTGQYFAVGQGYVSPSSQISDSRASAETCQWADGHLSYVANNVPCITDKGLASFEARTNLLLRSQDGTNWNSHGANAALTANAAQAPDGTQTGVSLTFSGSNAFVNVGFNSTTISALTTYTASAYYRPAQSGVFVRVLSLTNGGSTDGCAANFGVSSGIVSFTSATPLAAGVCVGGGAVYAGNGWYRLWAIGSTAAATSVTACICNYPGNITESAWGGQIEQGAFPTPYIPTAGTTVARNADNITSVLGSALDVALRVTPASTYVQTNVIFNQSVAARVVNFGGGWLSDFGSSGTAFLSSDATNVATANAPSGSNLTRAKISYIYSASLGGAAIWGSGAKGTNASQTRGTATGTITIGDLGNGTRELDGYIERLSVSPNIYQLFPTTP